MPPSTLADFSLQCRYFDVSALDNTNISAAFRAVCNMAADRMLTEEPVYVCCAASIVFAAIVELVRHAVTLCVYDCVLTVFAQQQPVAVRIAGFIRTQSKRFSSTILLLIYCKINCCEIRAF